jgi:hypothetical protein
MHTDVCVLWRILRQDSGSPGVIRKNMNYTPVPENRDGVFFLYLGKPRFGHLSVLHGVYRDCFFGAITLS